MAQWKTISTFLRAGNKSWSKFRSFQFIRSALLSHLLKAYLTNILWCSSHWLDWVFSEFFFRSLFLKQTNSLDQWIILRHSCIRHSWTTELGTPKKYDINMAAFCVHLFLGPVYVMTRNSLKWALNCLRLRWNSDSNIDGHTRWIWVRSIHKYCCNVHTSVYANIRKRAHHIRATWWNFTNYILCLVWY